MVAHETWTRESIGAPVNNVVSIVWSPEDELFVGYNSRTTDYEVVSSPDGENWTAHTITTGTVSNRPGSIAYSPLTGVYLIQNTISETGKELCASDDLGNWTCGHSRPGRGIVWSPIHEVFVAANRGISENDIRTSPDGINWTTQTHPTTDLTSITCSPTGRCIGTGATTGGTSIHEIIFSDDTVNWVGLPNPFSGGCAYSVAYAEHVELWVSAVDPDCTFSSTGGPNTGIWTSTDGESWTGPLEVGIGDHVDAINYHPETHVLTMTREVGIVTSTNGEDWFVRFGGSVAEDAQGSRTNSIAYSPQLSTYISADHNDPAQTSLIFSSEDPLPVVNIVDAPIEVNNKLTFSVTANVTQSGEPVSDHTVGLLIDPHIAETGTTDSNGEVTFSSLQITVPGTYTILVTNEAGNTDSQSLTVVSETLPGHIESGDKFLGVLPMDPVAEGFDQDIRTTGWLFGIFLVLLLIGAMTAAWGAVGIVLGALVGMIIAFATGLFPIWILFIIILVIIVVVRLLFAIPGGSE